MLYNVNNKKIQTVIDCFTCPHYNPTTLGCSGLNKVCFEYDEKTQTIIDGVTKLPINVNKKEN